MKNQPNRDYVSNDDVQTPPALARRLVAHFQPTGHILEPCSGGGHFLRALRAHSRRFAAPDRQHVSWAEIKRGRDFFAWTQPVDWIVTNPPWSEIRRFLQHAMTLADHVVFLVTINHLWTKARLRDLRTAGFGLREIVLVDMPKSFPQSGFQLGAVHLEKGWQGPIALSDLTARQGGPRRAAHAANSDCEE